MLDDRNSSMTFDPDLDRCFHREMDAGGTGQNSAFVRELDQLLYEIDSGLLGEEPSDSVTVGSETATSRGSGLAIPAGKVPAAKAAGVSDSERRETSARGGPLDHKDDLDADDKPGLTGPFSAYAFPKAKQKELASLSDGELFQRMEACARLFDVHGRKTSYLEVREEVCALALIANERHLTSPRFRPQRTPPRLCATPEERSVARDRQVIDLHWLWCHKHDKVPDAAKYRGLFAAEEFSFQLASEFALEEWSPERKMSCLRLYSELEWALATFQSEQTRKKWIKIRGKLATIERALEDSAARRPILRQHLEEWIALWVAWRIVGDSPSQLAKMMVFLMGSPQRDHSGVAKRLKMVLGRIHQKAPTTAER